MTTTNLSRRCPSVALATDPESDRPTWVQVARGGTFKGYAGGELEFTLDEQIFSQVIANFRAHPAFARRDGVIAWDFHHSSEMSPSSGSIPERGAPAQGWVLDLDVRRGSNGPELWALTKWLEPARSYIREGRYRWASISLVFDAVDAVSGKSVGAVITSIALTNTPFIEGMSPLTAERGNQQHTQDHNLMTDISKFPGRNSYEQAMAYLRAQPGGDTLTYDECFLRARDIVRDAQLAALDGAEYDPFAGTTDQPIARNPKGEGPVATEYKDPSHRSDEFVADAKRLFPDLESGSETTNVASQLQRAASHGYHAGLEGKTWDEMWIETWEGYRANILPDALPERMQSGLDKLERAMRDAFERERATSADLRARGLLSLNIANARGRNTFERVMDALEREQGERYARLPFGERHRIAAQAMTQRKIVGA